MSLCLGGSLISFMTVYYKISPLKNKRIFVTSHFLGGFIHVLRFAGHGRVWFHIHGVARKSESLASAAAGRKEQVWQQ